MSTATALMDKEEKHYRYRQMRQALEPFGKMLYHIYSIMPCQGYILDLKAGTFEPQPPLPEWQERIDKVIEMRDEYIKLNFPEFYEEQHNKD
jgi:hypothetical protein